MTTKTIAEIEDLKASWEADGTWDIEDTEGFEDHQEELLAYRKLKEQEWKEKREEEIRQKAIKLGCPDNLKLALYVERLEDHIESLEKRLEKLENA